jgi:hypothetical protein
MTAPRGHVAPPQPGTRSVLRSVAVPTEHGGWDLTLEPVVLGLVIFPSGAGLCLASAALVGFMARMPLKVVLVDASRGRHLERTTVARRLVAAELLDRFLQPGQTVIADKGFAGAEFEQHVRSLGGQRLRPDRKDEQPRHGSLGGIRQWIESTFDTLKDQLSLERHGGRTLTGLVSRTARRLLALSAVILYNWHTGNPGRHLTAYDH